MLEVVLNEACQPGPGGLEQARLAGFLKRLVQEEPTRTARRLLRESSLAAIVLLLAPESESGLNVQDFEPEEIGFTTAILNDPEIKKRVIEFRALRWRMVWQKYRLTTQQSAALFAAIAPKLAWKRTMEEILPLLDRLAVSISDELRLLEIPENAGKALGKLDLLRHIRSEIILNEGNEAEVLRFDALLESAEYSFNSLKDARFNMIFESAFVPTEKDIENAQ